MLLLKCYAIAVIPASVAVIPDPVDPAVIPVPATTLTLKNSVNLLNFVNL